MLVFPTNTIFLTLWPFLPRSGRTEEGNKHSSTDQVGFLELVHGVLKEAGFLTDDRPLKGSHPLTLPLPYHPSSSHKTTFLLSFRPLLLLRARRVIWLHCALLNASHRRTPPSGQCRRDPNGVARHTQFSFMVFLQTPDNVLNDFGTWDVDGLQTCKMGSWAPDGKY